MHAGMEMIAGAKGVTTPVYSILIDLIKTSQASADGNASAEAEAYLESIVHVSFDKLLM
jgi:hypothetical protein